MNLDRQERIDWGPANFCEKPNNLSLFINILDFANQEAKSVILYMYLYDKSGKKFAQNSY